MAKKIEFKCIKANIADEDGNKILVGQTVSFGKKYAEHYRKLGYIEMPLPDFDEEEAEMLTATADDIAEEAKDEFVPVDRGGNPLEEKSSTKPATKRRRL